MFSYKYCEISENTYFKERVCFWTGFRKGGLFRTFFVDSRFQNNPDQVGLQKYQPLSN